MRLIDIYYYFYVFLKRRTNYFALYSHTQVLFISEKNNLDMLEVLYTSIWSYETSNIASLDYLIGAFHQLGPLGRVGLRVAMSVCLCVCVSVILCHRVQFFSRPLIGPQIT